PGPDGGRALGQRARIDEDPRPRPLPADLRDEGGKLLEAGAHDVVVVAPPRVPRDPSLRPPPFSPLSRLRACGPGGDGRRDVRRPDRDQALRALQHLIRAAAVASAWP